MWMSDSSSPHPTPKTDSTASAEKGLSTYPRFTKDFARAHGSCPFGHQPVLLGLVHGVDIRNYDSETRQAWAQELANDLRFVTSEKKNNRLILIGDFNMNPYGRP